MEEAATPGPDVAPEAAPPADGLGRSLGSAAPLLVSLALLMVGTSLHGSVLGLRGDALGFRTVTLGAVLSGYYLGFLVGSITITRVIAVVGHVRTFAGLASTASAAVLLHAVWASAAGWWVLRVISGVCLSGLFVVTESWLNSAATNRSRGRLLGAYMVVFTGSIAVGQLLLATIDPQGFAVIVLASVLVSVAVVPISLMPGDPPHTADPAPMSMRSVASAAPLAIVGAAASGLVGGAVIGAGAVYGVAQGLSVNRIAVLLAAVLGTALLLQFPLGQLSDRVDRRWVLAGTTLAGTVAAVAAAALDVGRFPLLVVAAAVAGGTSYPLYALSSAHLNDWLDPSTTVAAGARMVLLSGAGAVAGPLGAAIAIEGFGPEGFFLLIGGAHAVTTAFALYRLTRRAPAPEEQRSTFAPLPPGSAPTLAGLTPDAAEVLHPVDEHDDIIDGREVHWRQRGDGPPVVLVHDAGSSSLAWDGVQVDLADRGHRAIAHDLRGHGRSGPGARYEVDDHVADLTAVLDHLDLPRVALVGHGAGASIAASCARDDPSRVVALVLVGAEHDLARRRAPSVRRAADRTVQAAARGVLGTRAAAHLGASVAVPRRRKPEVHRRLAADLAAARRPALTATRRSAHRAAERFDPATLRPPTLWVRGGRLRPRTDDPSPLFVVPDAGHYVQLEQPTAVAEAIAGFLAQLARDRST